MKKKINVIDKGRNVWVRLLGSPLLRLSCEAAGSTATPTKQPLDMTRLRQPRLQHRIHPPQVPAHAYINTDM
jgi:hypothetical protein